MEKVSNLRTIPQNRKLFGLMGRLGIKNKEDMGNLVWSHTEGRTTHTSELTFIECMTLIQYLERMLASTRMSLPARVDEFGSLDQQAALDKKRKGVIRAIFSWMESRGETPTMKYVKAMACRAAGVERFNDISGSGLTRIYNEFCKKQQVRGVINNFKI